MSQSNEKAWRCTVCGYVHRGPAPPDECPVCGAPKDAFEEHALEVQPAAQKQAQRWRCLNCSYVHDAANPPDVCPVCGAPADCFEPVAEPTGGAAGAGKVGKVAIVGAGVAGLAAAEAIKDASPDTAVTLISKETERPYYRLNLTRYLAGELEVAHLPLKPEDWYAERGVDLRLGAEVYRIDPDGRALKLRAGQEVRFDKLILTAGAHPFMPAFPGVYREGVTNLRTLDDAQRILGAELSGARCVCIGGGLLGLETAGALARRGAQVTLLEGHGWLLPRQLNSAAGTLLGRYVRDAGIELRAKARTREILGDERVRGVQLEDESVVEADLVVVATGVRPNSYLARMAGLEVNKGVVVDNLLRTSASDVFAAGDVAEHRGVVYGTWAPAQYQGSIAGRNAVGAGIEFGGIPRSNALKVLQVELFSVGQIEPEDASYDTVDEEKGGRYVRLMFRDSHLVGAILLGDAEAAPRVKKAIENRMDLSRLLQQRPTAREALEHIAAKVSAG